MARAASNCSTSRKLRVTCVAVFRFAILTLVLDQGFNQELGEAARKYQQETVVVAVVRELAQDAGENPVHCGEVGTNCSIPIAAAHA